MRVTHGKIQAGLLAAIAAALTIPATAAAKPPRITDPPEVTGDTTVGKTVTAGKYDYTGGGEAEAFWSWRRCEGVDEDDCEVIPNTNAPSYRIVAADTGRRLRVFLFVRNDDGEAWALSSPSAEVKPAPKPQPSPTPRPSPTPTPEPEPSPAPQPQPVTTPAPTLAPTVPAGAKLPAKPKMMRPAPLIRIRGRTTPGGARITLLTVSAPRGARISLRCRGRSCPVKKWARATKVTRLLRFERVLAAGTKLTIRVTKRGRIGKYTQIVIRDGRAPWRRDRCVDPGSSRPRRCPSV